MPPQDATNTAPTTPPSFTRFSNTTYLAIFLVLATLVVGYLVKDKINPPLRAFDPQGTIFLTLSHKGVNDVGIYALDLSTQNLSAYYAPTDTKAITASRLSAATTTLLFATNATMSSEKRTGLFQIAAYSKETNSLQQVTKSNTTFKRHPSYSAALDLFVYGGKDAASTTLSGTASEFNVYTRDSKGVEKKIGQGSIPTLTPDGKSVVVMRKDGLAVLDLVTGTSEVIWPLNAGVAQINQQFTVSAAGNRVAWSNPNEGIIYVVEVKSWTPFKAVAAPQKIEAHAFWPAFSPEGDYLAFEEVEWGAVPTKPRLVIYDLVTHKKKTIQDLDAFVQERMFISGWYK